MAAFGDDEMDDVFKALADPSRRMLLDRLNAHNGQTLRQLCAGLDMARQSVSKHLAVLEAAGLVTTVRRGREKLHYLNAAPISDIAERWISRYDQPRVEALADLKKALEETEVEAPSFVCTTYVFTTPELLWQGLTDPAFTRRHWQTELHTDWAKGSPVTWNNHGVLISGGRCARSRWLEASAAVPAAVGREGYQREPARLLRGAGPAASGPGETIPVDERRTLIVSRWVTVMGIASESSVHAAAQLPQTLRGRWTLHP